MLVHMAAAPGQKEAPHPIRPGRAYRTSPALTNLVVHRLWGFSTRVAQHPATRFVVLILLMMLQMILLWLLGQMVDVCLSVMELWVELARKHLEITL